MNVDHLLVHTVHVAAVSSVSVKGDPSYGSPVSVRCRIEGSTATLRSNTGLETSTQTRILTSTEIAKTSKVWLPGANTANLAAAKVPLKVRQAPTTDGSYTLWEILLG